MTVDGLISTSVDDCRGSLKCLLLTHPDQAYELASAVLIKMDAGQMEQKTRRAVCRSIKRLAQRELAS